MKKIENNSIIKWGLAFVPLLIVLLFYKSLPEEIPVHWDIDGSVQYGSQMNLWVNAGMSIAFAILFPVLRKIDPRKKNYDKFGKYYDDFQMFMMLFFIAITAVIVSESIHPGRLDVEMVIILLVGILFTIIGNMMPKFKNNFFVGIKTPWTLSNEEVWNKTHRLGGILWFFGGICIIAAGIILEKTALFVVVTLIVAVLAVIPVVMSYVWYKKIGREQ